MKRIVLCGSMKVKEEILKVANILTEKGYTVLVPEECFKDIPKSIASRKHFEKIIDSKNDTVLIVNVRNHGIENYIGPNSFAEIAFAFYFKKNIYLFNDIYEPYKDELEGWKVKVLNGNLDNLFK